jgi:hypothetical protein
VLATEERTSRIPLLLTSGHIPMLHSPRRQTEEERLYGVFAEDFDDDGGGRSGGRGKQKAQPTHKRGGMMFVKSGGGGGFGMPG